MKRTRVGAAQGAWWRFNSYEIEHGAIRPTRNAKLTRYDPWKAFWTTRNETAGQPPYQALMKLVHELKFRPGVQVYPLCLTPDSLDRILAWCSEYGPLGVLLSRWEAIALHPQEVSPRHFVQRKYFRGMGQSIHGLEVSGDVGEQKASVIIHALENVNPIEESPEKTWYKFFPTVEFRTRETFQYPVPYSDEFCHLYAERLMDFCNAARYIAKAAQLLQLGSQPTDGDSQLVRERALNAINLLRRPVTSILELEPDGTPRVVWEAPSLLASYAEMYVQDLLFGRPVLNCSCCGMPFVSSAYQAQYCSVKCRFRGQKQRVRQQQKEAKTRRAQGQSIPKIAAALGQDRKVVAGWFRRQ